MGKLILINSLIGGVLLLSSRFIDTVLYYLTGYLIVFSYLIIIILTIRGVKKRAIGTRLLDYIIITMSTLGGMTLIYVSTVWLIHLLGIRF